MTLRVYTVGAALSPTAVGVKDWATDPEQRARLGELSTRLTGVNAFAA
ncbi:hypothetical protein [Streptomyces achromogenes]|nr:hypothetical protein [Streptomyces achromogenes]